jgi:hypothetical protein
MPAKATLIALAMGILAACASEDPGASPENMALACQTMSCACVAQEKSLLRKAKTTDILWKTNGDAYCPKDFVLEKAAKK